LKPVCRAVDIDVNDDNFVKEQKGKAGVVRRLIKLIFADYPPERAEPHEAGFVWSHCNLSSRVETSAAQSLRRFSSNDAPAFPKSKNFDDFLFL